MLEGVRVIYPAIFLNSRNQLCPYYNTVSVLCIKCTNIISNSYWKNETGEKTKVPGRWRRVDEVAKFDHDKAGLEPKSFSHLDSHSFLCTIYLSEADASR
jgi:hypothetical protein